ncbi:MAG: TlpA disulfide reductase family protein [Anaerolineae bacterium]
MIQWWQNSSRLLRGLIIALVVVVALVLGLWAGEAISARSKGGAVASADRPPSVERDQLAPLFDLPTTTGQHMALADTAGDVVLVNFWATWCAPCREEMPVIEAAQQKYGPKGFKVISVNVQEAADPVAAYIQEVGVTFPILLDREGSVARTYRVQTLPRNFFLARDGRVVRIHPGELTPEIIERYLQELL